MAAALPYLAFASIAAVVQLAIGAAERMPCGMFIKREKLNVPTTRPLAPQHQMPRDASADIVLLISREGA